MVEALGFVAAFFELLGVFLLGKKIKWGFLSTACGNVCWITYVFLAETTYGLLLVCAIAFILNVKGFYHWFKSEKN